MSELFLRPENPSTGGTLRIRFRYSVFVGSTRRARFWISFRELFFVGRLIRADVEAVCQEASRGNGGEISGVEEGLLTH